MELEQLENQWRRLNDKLERQLAGHSARLQRLGVQHARQRINRQMVWPALDLAFDAAMLLASGAVLGEHWRAPMLAIPAACLLLASLAATIDNIRQLELISTLAWDGPIADIQTALSRLRAARIRQFKWIILLSPLIGLCMLVVAGALLMGARMGQLILAFNPGWVASNVAFALLCIPVGMTVARAMSNRWGARPFWRSVLDDIAGNSLTAARRELQQWAELTEEPAAGTDAS